MLRMILGKICRRSGQVRSQYLGGRLFLRIIVVSCVLLYIHFLVTRRTKIVEAAPAPVCKLESACPKEISILIENLDDCNKYIRDHSYQLLLKIGPPALKQFRNPKSGIYSGEGTVLKLRLLEEIQRRYGIQSVQCNGLEFVPFGDRVWQIPPPGQEQQITLGVKVTNVGVETISLYAPGTILPSVRGPDAGWIRRRVGCSSPGGPAYFPPIKPRESFSVSNFRVKLCRSANGKEVWLEGIKFGITFRFEDLKPGRYYLSFGCGHGPGEWGLPGPPEDGSRIWLGNIETYCFPIEIV